MCFGIVYICLQIFMYYSHDTHELSIAHFLLHFRMYLAHEHLAELMPIFDQIRARGECGNAYPLHVGSTAGPTLHMAHVNPNTCYWVICHNFYLLLYTSGCGPFSASISLFDAKFTAHFD